MAGPRLLRAVRSEPMGLAERLEQPPDVVKPRVLRAWKLAELAE